MMSIDLHTHSNFSDGFLTPDELVHAAKQAGLSALAVTDHDTIDGLEGTIRAGKKHQVEIVTGVEISVDHEDGSLHMLGYGFNQSDQVLHTTLTTLRQSRVMRNEHIIARLSELGYQISANEVVAGSPEGTYGRSHMAEFLVQTKQISSIDEAFDKLLKRGGPAYFDRYRPPIKNAIELIHNAGGIAVWAHPGLHRENRLNALLERLPQWVDFGLDGLESDYSLHSVELRDRLRRTALDQGLIFTGGSDYHGGLKTERRLGIGPDDRPISPDILDGLRERIRKIRAHK